MKKYLNQQDMKDRNSTNVFRLIRQRGPLTRRQIEAETGLSWGAVSNVTAKLIEAGYIRECKEAEGSAGAVGRTPIGLEADGERHFVIGVDVNRSGFHALMTNLRGEVIHSEKLPPCHGDGEELLSAICDAVRVMLDYADGMNVLCIGVAMQGLVDAENGISVHFPRCNAWKDVPLAEILEERFGLPVFLEHDPNCTLYAYSAPRRIQEAILVRIDKGIGMAVMMNGRIFERFGAFELGQTLVTENRAGTACTLEACASMTGMAERAGVPFESLAERAGRGDADAIGYFHVMADALALAIRNVSKLLNVSDVVLCGDMLTYKPLFYDRLIAQACSHSAEKPVTFSETDVAEAALGAAMIALERHALRLE